MAEKADRVVKQIQDSLSINLAHPRSQKVIRNNVALLGPYCFGQCWPASEALYFLWGRKRGYKLYVLSVNDVLHRWLQHPETGDLIDPTMPQMNLFTAEPYPYHLGKPYRNHPIRPSKRAAELMRRVRAAKK